MKQYSLFIHINNTEQGMNIHKQYIDVRRETGIFMMQALHLFIKSQKH